MRRLAFVALIAACSRDARVERGRYLASGILQCFTCHAPRDLSKPGWPPFPDMLGAGSLMWQDGPLHMYAPNITRDVETGAGGWSEQQLADAIARGIGHDGRTLSLPMYWASFKYLSDEDLAAVVAYVRTLAPVRSPIPKRSLAPEREKALAEAKHPPRQPVPPPANDPVARGKYFLKVADCGGCHTSWEAPANAGFLAGGNAVDRQGHVVFSANITPSATGIGGWTEAQFIAAMRGKAPGHAVDPIMPWVTFRNMTDDDLAAIFAALKTLRPVAHAVSNYDPPTDCPRCGQKHGLGERNGPKIAGAVRLDAAVLDALAGRYRMVEDGAELTLERAGDGLALRFPGSPPLPIMALSPSELDSDFLPSPARVERDASGAVTRLVMAWVEDDVAERVRP